MRLPRYAIALAGAAFVFGLIARLPAAVALNWVLPEQVRTSGISGTLWRGSVRALEIERVVIGQPGSPNAIDLGSLAVGPVEWQWRPAALLRGRLGVAVESGLPGGFFAGEIAVRGRDVALRDVRAAVDLQPLTRRSSAGPTRGRVTIDLATARLADGWPIAADGSATLAGLSYPPIGDQPLGDYRITLASGVADGVVAQAASLQGPLDLDAALTLKPDRSYALTGTVAATEAAPRGFRQALNQLGRADADGRYRLDRSGRWQGDSAP